MKRRAFLKRFGAAAAFGCCAGVSKAGIRLSNNIMHNIIGRRRPNVIYILADDMGYADAGCYGQTKIETPIIDMMAAEGIKFTQHYSGNAVCCPSRNNLMTGLHPGHAFHRGNYPYNSYQLPLPAGTRTIAHVFQEHDYVTGAIGKWGLGGPGTTGEPDRQGFDHFYGYLGQIQAHDYYHPDLWRYTHEDGWSNPSTGGVYTHDLMTDDALEFIQKYKDRPFFLYIPYCIPHGKFQLTEYAQYANTGWTADQKSCAAMISRMDRDIGRMIDLLKSLGLDDDTLIIFTSDNGPSHPDLTSFFDRNGVLRDMKGHLYEGGIRVPLVARWPGKIKPGTTTDHISAFWDFYPTCCDLLGVKPPKVKWSDDTWHDTDGISFLPTLLGKDSMQKEHDYLYWELHDRYSTDNDQRVQAVRQGKWKFLRHHLTKPQAEWVSKLYDLDNDISETTNLATTYPAKLAELTAIADAAHICNPYYHTLSTDTC